MPAPNPITPPGLSLPAWADARVCAVIASDDAQTASETALIGNVVDGVTLVAGDRVLVRTASPFVNSGIYVASASPARATDADAGSEFTTNKLVKVTAGQTFAGRTFRYAGPNNPTVGTTGLPFVLDPQSISPPA